MRSFRRREHGLEAQLRAARAKPRDEFREALVESVASQPSWARVRPRVALAGALTAGLLTAFSAVGGLGYAASATADGVGAAIKVVKKSTSKQSRRALSAQSPASQQYKRYICHKTGSRKNEYVLIYVSENAVPAHQRHEGDTVYPPGTTRKQAEATCPSRGRHDG